MVLLVLTLSHLQIQLQQTTFENIVVAKGEIAYDEQFLFLQLVFNVVCSRFVVSGEGLA